MHQDALFELPSIANQWDYFFTFKWRVLLSTSTFKTNQNMEWKVKLLNEWVTTGRYVNPGLLGFYLNICVLLKAWSATCLKYNFLQFKDNIYFPVQYVRICIFTSIFTIFEQTQENQFCWWLKPVPVYPGHYKEYSRSFCSSHLE